MSFKHSYLSLSLKKKKSQIVYQLKEVHSQCDRYFQICFLIYQNTTSYSIYLKVFKNIFNCSIAFCMIPALLFFSISTYQNKLYVPEYSCS